MSVPATESATASVPAAPAFRRVLLKLSGEALMGERSYGQDPERIAGLAGEVPAFPPPGVPGSNGGCGGNIFPEPSSAGHSIDPTTPAPPRPHPTASAPPKH